MLLLRQWECCLIPTSVRKCISSHPVIRSHNFFFTKHVRLCPIVEAKHIAVFLPRENLWHLGRFSQQNTWFSFFKQGVLTQKYITASNISTFACTWKDLKVNLVLSEELNVGTCWVLHKSEGCFGYISTSSKVLITYSSPAETGNSPWSLSAQKKEAVLCTSLGCLGDDLHIKVCLVGQKQHKVVIFFNDKNIQTQHLQSIST